MHAGSAWVLPAIAHRIEVAARARGVPAATLDAIGPRTGAATARGPRRASADRARALLAHVVREIGDDAFPWELARGARPVDYGAYGFAVQASRDVQQALERAAAYFPRVGTTARLRVISTPGRFGVRLERVMTSDAETAPPGVEYMLGQVVTLLATVSGGVARPRAVRLAHRARGDGARVAAILGCAPTYGALVDEIELDRAIAAVELPRRDDDLAEFFDRVIERESTPLGVTGEVRALLDDGATVGGAGEERIARTLEMSTRTMRRRLAAEGTSLRALVDDVRRDVADAAMGDPHISLAALAAR